MAPRFSQAARLIVVIVIMTSFCFAELAVGFYTQSLALIADAFHIVNDLVGLVVALVAIVINKSERCPQTFTFGWQRASLLGAFFNGALLIALGTSVVLQGVERFIHPHDIEQPVLVLIAGGVGLATNILCASLLHTHHHHHAGESKRCSNDAFVASLNSKHAGHKHELTRITTASKHHHHHDLGTLGVLLHLCGDAINNIGVMLAGAIMWRVQSPSRYYADPAISTFIGLVILISAIPLTKSSGAMLLNSAPIDLDMVDLRDDLEKVHGINSIHEMHVWQLNQYKTVASLHVSVSDSSLHDFEDIRKTLNECFHAYGVNSVTVQPEVQSLPGQMKDYSLPAAPFKEARMRECSISCGDTACEALACCHKE